MALQIGLLCVHASAHIGVNPDTVNEPNEAAVLEFYNPDGDAVLVGEASALRAPGTILDDDGGPDQLVGGAGTDAATYATSDDAVVVDLQSGKGDAGTAWGDQLSCIENVVGSTFDDTLSGDARANQLDSGTGANAAVQFARITGAPTISNNDFTVVA